MIKRFYISIIFLLLFGITVNAQSTIILRAIGIGYHPFNDVNRGLYEENKIDANANFIAEPGIYLGIEKYIKGNFLSLQLMTGILSDAAAKQAGFTSLSFRRMFYHKYKHHFSAAFGGALLYRKDWHSLDDYRVVDDFNLNGKWQNKWSLVGELNYNYYIAKRLDMGITLMYGYQYRTITPTFTFRFWINPNVKVKECDCKNRFNKGKFRKFWKRVWR